LIEVDKRSKIILIIFIVAHSIAAQNPYIQHYTTQNGLPSNTVYQIFQDSQKFVWFSTDAGVVRFDGSTFKTYRKKDGLSSNDVIRIKEDSFGRIWFFNYNASVNYYLKDKIYNEKNASFLSTLMGKGFFIDFFLDSNQTIFFYNWQREVFALDSNNSVTKNFLFNSAVTLPLVWNTRESVRVAYVEKTKLNDLRIFTIYGIYSQKNFNSKTITIDTLPRILSVFPTRPNHYYINTTNLGLISLNSKLVYKQLKLPFNSIKIKSIIEDHDGYLWITAYDLGVFCFKNNRQIKHFKIYGALGIFQDNENNIWVSSQSDGVYLINHDILMQNHLDISNFDGLGIENLCLSTKNGIWCNNGYSIFKIYNNKTLRLFQPDRKKLIQFVYQFKNNELFVSEKSNTFFTLENLFESKHIQQINYLKRNIFSFYAKKILINKSGDKISLYDQNRILQTSIFNMFKDSKQNYLSERINYAFYNCNDDIIINGRKNYIYKNNRLYGFEDLKKFNGTTILDHLIIDFKTEIFNIDGDSLYIYRNKKFYNLTSVFNISIDLQIKKILYNKSTLYIGTLSNIFICDNPLDIIMGKTVQLQSLNIRFNNINDILFKSDTLYVASNEGLTIISEASIKRSKSNAPMPYLQSVTIDDFAYSLPLTKLSLVGKKNIHLICKCISFTSTPIIYSYILEGSDNSWTSGTGPNITVIYQNLHKGSYTFKLRMRKSNSDWSPPLELKIVIYPTFWEYPIVWIAIALIVAALIVFVVIQIKNQKIKKTEIDNQLILMEQKALQSMMNPHFIFNSLGSIQNYLLKNKAGEAVLYLSQFARLIRQNLHAINLAMISLDEEINRLNNYLELEQLRLENKFDYSIEVEDILLDENIFIPSMIIQPFAENSIWHGIAGLASKGLISIKFTQLSDKVLKIIIEDNGTGMEQSKDQSYKSKNHLHLGMLMTHKRLVLLSKKYNIDAHMKHSDLNPGSENLGTRVELFVPYSYGNISS